jgi:hypothetical protein
VGAPGRLVLPGHQDRLVRRDRNTRLQRLEYSGIHRCRLWRAGALGERPHDNGMVGSHKPRTTELEQRPCIDARITVTFVPRLSIRVSRVVSVELCASTRTRDSLTRLTTLTYLTKWVKLARM